MMKMLSNLSGKTKLRLKSLISAVGLMPIARVIYRRQYGMSHYADKIAFIKRWAWLDTEDSNFYYRLTEMNRDQLAQTVATVTGVTPTQVLGYFAELEGDDRLREHIKSGISSARYGRDIRVEFGRRLGWYAFIRVLKPRVVIETGVDHGVGACVITSALMMNASEGKEGRYYGTELRPDAGKLLSGDYARFGQVLYGDSIETLQKFDQPIDIFINDSDHSADYEYREYQVILDKLAPESLILGDNSHATDKLSRFSAEQQRSFLFFAEKPLDHWYPGAGIGISFRRGVASQVAC
ncbi:MAG: class I SAM-dependent methyltransferase [Hydrogenophaga sp.]|uniref:class I SAM-dependent methyltransferase n=1 Tax=Hydrogenophaga sp. TaxID=1904254 RepID=UPI001D783419|nr:class I SAM-dependent methyltransferase [Hydrogenophaga sp.]MBX3611676.1 class I SAM-dependent methyltransferase [Hydrogenophaga sp.]